MWVCRDSRVSGARGAAPCCGKAAISERGESSLCGDKPYMGPPQNLFCGERRSKGADAVFAVRRKRRQADFATTRAHARKGV